MGYWTLANTFSGLSGNVSASTLDTNFQQLAVAPIFCSTGGTANAITLTPANTGTAAITLPGSYIQGMTFVFEAALTNTSGTVTVDVSGIGAINVYRDNNLSLNIGDIQSNSIYQVIYDGTNFHLLNPAAGSEGDWNKIINPSMTVDQRRVGASLAAAADGSFFVDRWKYNFVAPAAPALVATIGRSNTVPTAARGNSLLWSCTTAHATVAAGDYATISQSIEGYNVIDFRSNAFTLAFYVRSPKTGTHCVSFRYGSTNSYVVEYTVNAANTYERKVIAMSALPNVGSSTTGVGLEISWALMAGTTYQAPAANAWNAANYIATANQVNVGDNAGNNFYLAGVQLYMGGIARPFENRLFQQELALCQRYYQKSFPQTVAVAQNAGLAGAFGFTQVVGASASQNGNGVNFCVTMRDAPSTITLYNPSAANALARNNTVAADWGATTTSNASDSGFVVSGTTALGSAAGNANYVHWSADAEL